jgi:hypothetical protein
VVGADVHRVALQHRLENADDFFGPFVRRAVGLPQLPRVQIHQALGVQRGGVEIVRVYLDHIGHRVRVIDRQGFQVGFRVVRVALHQRIDVGALVGRRVGGERFRALRFFIGRELALGIDIEVDVGSECERDTPVRHRRRRVELGGAAERSDRFVVIETVDERQSLIEELLRVGTFGRDRMMKAAHTRHERRLLWLADTMAMLLRSCRRESAEKEKGCHLALPFQTSDFRAQIECRFRDFKNSLKSEINLKSEL